MSDAAKLTVKVKLHPAALPPEPDTPVVQHAPWSKPRIVLALLILVGAVVAGYQFLRQPAALEQTPAAELQDSPHSAASDIASATAESEAEPAVEPVESGAVTAEPLPSDSTVSADSAGPAESAVPNAPTELAASAPPPPSPQASSAPALTQSSASADKTAVAAAPAAPSAAAQATEPLSVLPAGFSRIVLTSQMNNLQPGPAVGQQIGFAQIKRLYLFTELNGYAGQVLRHRWYYRDTLHTDAVLTIEDSPWRTYSENWLLDDQRGPWRVEIVDQTQKVIFQFRFTYQ